MKFDGQTRSRIFKPVSVLYFALFVLLSTVATAQKTGNVFLYDSATSAAASISSGANSMSWSQATESRYSSPYLVVGISINISNDAAASVSSVTYNASSLVLLGSLSSGGATRERLELWGLANPANGTNTITVTFSTVATSGAPIRAIGGSGTFYGVSTIQNVVLNNGNGTSPTLAVTSSATTSNVIAFLADQGNRTPTVTGTGQVDNFQVSTGGSNTETYLDMSAISSPTAGSNTMSYSLSGGSGWVEIGAEIVWDGTFTAVGLKSFHALPFEDEVELSWNTSSESKNLGFNVYRETGGQRVKVNPSLIAGASLAFGTEKLVHTNRSYKWIDSTPSSGSSQYWLEDIDTGGHSTWHGPYPLEILKLQSRNVALINGTLNARLLSTPITNVAHYIAMRNSGSLASPLHNKKTRDNQAWLNQQNAVKIVVEHNGWYSIPLTSLASQFSGNLDTSQWQLFVEGVPVAFQMWQQSPGTIGSNDSFQFYGMSLDSPYSGQRVYWLVNNGRGNRISTYQYPYSGLALLNSHPQTVIYQPRTVYFAPLLTGGGNNFFGDPVTGSGLVLSIPTPNTVASVAFDAQLTIRLQGVVDAVTHTVQVAMNGNVLGTMEFNGMQSAESIFPVSMVNASNGTADITLTSLNGDTDISVTDTVTLTYPHSWTVESNAADLTVASGSPIVLNGFSRADIRVFDITTPNAPIEIQARISGNNNSYTAGFYASNGYPSRRKILAITSAQWNVPVAITRHTPTSLGSSSNEADMIILGPAALLPGARPLLNLHTQQGMKVKAVALEDVFDEFNYGEKSPFAIRAFLQAANESWGHVPGHGPHYLLLFGDGSLDPHNYLGFGNQDLMPTKMVDTSQITTASDDWFTDFHDTGVPQISTGRLPVHSVAEGLAVSNRLYAYATGANSGTWSSQAFLLSGPSSDNSFDANSVSLTQTIPAIIQIQTVSSSDSTARTQLLSALDHGQVLVNFMGHGSEQDWAGGSLLDISDIPNIQNNGHLPVIVSMTCLNGMFQDVFADALAKSLILAPNGTAAAVWASSGLNSIPAQGFMDQAFVQSLFSSSAMTFGDAARIAKSKVDNLDLRRTWILFGDPAMTLPSGAFPPVSSTTLIRAARLKHH